MAWLRSSIKANGNYSRSHFILAAALAHLGRLDEAQSEVQAGSAIDQTFTIARFSAHVISHNSAYLSGRERLIDGMRKAGVPEDSATRQQPNPPQAPGPIDGKYAVEPLRCCFSTTDHRRAGAGVID